MQLLPFLSLLATALAGQSFHALIIRSGSQYQYTLFTASGSNVVAGSKDYLNLVLNSDGSLIDSTSKKYLHVGDDKSVTLADNAQTGFSFKNGYLAFNGSSGFEACSGGKIEIDSKDSSCLGVAVRAYTPKETPDVTGSSPATSTTSTVSSAHASLSSVLSSVSSVKPKTSSTSSVASATPSAKAGKKFGLIAIHSGSAVQNAGIKKVKEHAHVFSVGGSAGDFLTLTFDSDNSSLVDQDGRGINVDQTTGELGDVAPFGRQPATKGFAVDNGHLTYNGSSDWKACPSGEKTYSLSKNDCTGGIDIALKVVYA